MTPMGHDSDLMIIARDPAGTKSPSDCINLSLLRTMAAGRLYVLGNDGQMVQVQLLSQWSDDDRIITTTTKGTQYDEDGNDWKVGQ